MTQADLANMLGVSESTVGKWILKKAFPRMSIIEKLSVIFNRPKAYFYDDHEERQTYYLNPETIHGQMEYWIIIFEGIYHFVYIDFRGLLSPGQIIELRQS